MKSITFAPEELAGSSLWIPPGQKCSKGRRL